ncbi:MAG TPA: hypothetical protein DIW20_03635 [Rhodospirillaceae bacterium]|nr:hypothetical protein [Rhodospirillaceae bacterium]
MRKLLNPAEVAGKLGRSTNWFLRTRDQLHKRGFPRPVLGDGKNGRPRWDEGAIDAWLDSQMSPDLRALRQGSAKVSATDYTAQLEQRLQQLGARP